MGAKNQSLLHERGCLEPYRHSSHRCTRSIEVQYGSGREREEREGNRIVANPKSPVVNYFRRIMRRSLSGQKAQCLSNREVLFVPNRGVAELVSHLFCVKECVILL